MRRPDPHRWHDPSTSPDDVAKRSPPAYRIFSFVRRTGSRSPSKQLTGTAEAIRLTIDTACPAGALTTE